VVSGYRTLQAKNDFTKALQVLQRRLIETKTELPQPRRESKNPDNAHDPDHEKPENNKDNYGDDTKERYLLGSYLTLADIVIVATLIYPFQMAFNKDYFEQSPREQQQGCSLKEVAEWFERCVQRPEFQAVLGTVEIGSKLATASLSSSSSSSTVEPPGTTASSSLQ
jgi:glutathione S-transferase